MDVRDEAARFTRRKLFTVGGFTVATAAVLAACKKKAVPPVIPSSGSPDSVDKPPAQVIDDIVLLRTASSLEHTVVDAYQFALDSGLLPSAASPAVTTFQDHHRKHAASFEQATATAGGEAFTKRNDIVWNALIAPQITKDSKGAVAVDDEQSALEFVYSLESVAAATYQAMVPVLSKPALRQAVMAAAGVDSRHGAVLASFITRALIAPGMTAPAVATTTTTTAASGGATTTTIAPPPKQPIYRVPGAFGPVSSALGPNSFEYYEKPATTTATT
ncbi:MAG: ferritin-like domain-containing protein [Acidimicrobiales bacterium]